MSFFTNKGIINRVISRKVVETTTTKLYQSFAAAIDDAWQAGQRGLTIKDAFISTTNGGYYTVEFLQVEELKD